MDNFARGMLHIPFEPLAFVAPGTVPLFSCSVSNALMSNKKSGAGVKTERG